MALQCAPLIVQLPLTGFATDHLDRRRLLIARWALGVGADSGFAAALVGIHYIRL
jgi:hypothetical protein